MCIRDSQKVAEMVGNNVLGFQKLNIFSLKRSKNEFVFIFAARQQDAIQLYTETYHQMPLNCHEYLLDFQFARGKEVISFRDMRKEFVSFPTVVGCYRKGLWSSDITGTNLSWNEVLSVGWSEENRFSLYLFNPEYREL